MCGKTVVRGEAVEEKAVGLGAAGGPALLSGVDGCCIGRSGAAGRTAD